jgi:hypothetical protein
MDIDALLDKLVEARTKATEKEEPEAKPAADDKKEPTEKQMQDLIRKVVAMSSKDGKPRGKGSQSKKKLINPDISGIIHKLTKDE